MVLHAKIDCCRWYLLDRIVLCPDLEPMTKPISLRFSNNETGQRVDQVIVSTNKTEAKGKILGEPSPCIPIKAAAY